MAACNHARADGQSQCQGARIVQTVQSVAPVAVRVAYGCFFFRRGVGFEVFFQTAQHEGHGPALEAFLLGAAPRIGLSRTAGGRGGGQMFADVKVVAPAGGLRGKHFPALQTNPLGPVSHGVDLAVQSPAGFPGAMPPTSPGLNHTAEGDSRLRPGALLGLRRHQPPLFPRARTFPLPRAGIDRAEHRAVSLGDDAGGSLRRQHAKRLILLGLQLSRCPLRVDQGGRAHAAGVDLKAIMFPDARRCPDKGMFTAKVRQHPIQPS